jgi:hypothetical protein
MNVEIDYDLAPDQWETLKALRLPAPRCAILSASVVETLVALQLAAMIGGDAEITRRGRDVLLRGSPRLWDVAA